MQLTKYTHACVRLETDGRALLIDPGIWAEDAAFDGVVDVLITHEHFDHVDVDRLAKAGDVLDLRSRRRSSRSSPRPGVTAQTVALGDTFEAAGFSVRAVGGLHAEIYDGLPGCANLGYVIDGTSTTRATRSSCRTPRSRRCSCRCPGRGSSSPRRSTSCARSSPVRAFPIHDAMLSDKGLAGMDNWLAMKGETDYARIAEATPSRSDAAASRSDRALGCDTGATKGRLRALPSILGRSKSARRSRRGDHDGRMTTIYIVQHGEKERAAGDPGLTELGRAQATRTARWICRS